MTQEDNVDDLQRMVEDERREEYGELQSALHTAERNLARHTGAWRAISAQLAGVSPRDCYQPEPEAMVEVINAHMANLQLRNLALEEQALDYRRHFEAAARQVSDHAGTIARLRGEIERLTER